jgi:two-component system KDP operon response regulator KdpE
MTTAAFASQPLALIADDELAVRQQLRASLDFAGYRVIEAKSGKQAITLEADLRPDLMILDLGLPDMEGLEVIKAVRQSSQLPILVLSARAGEADKIAALDAGANDYVGKPFNVGELLARLRVALRGASNVGLRPVRLRLGGIEIDLRNHAVSAGSRQVRLTPIEMRLLKCLARRPGTVLSHRHLMREVWGPTYEAQSHYLRIYMMNLRHKLEPEPARPRYLLTEPGIGYRLMTDGGE